MSLVWERRWIAPVLDGVCLIAFVVVGKENHNVTTGFRWFWEVLWPLAVGWFAVGIAVGLYRQRRLTWLRWAATLAFGTLLTMWLRTFTGRSAFTAYTVVVYIFVGLTTLGWRGVAGLVASRLHPRSPAV
ncbi:MAG: DUF3054 family protein [Acidimicrobiia bacterium]|nr:DUF3054 domain-containing protein [Acidimicrobiia bacterium]MCL4292269.1 DUF3054 family protein [Acidimicrobiia bacterium]